MYVCIRKHIMFSDKVLWYNFLKFIRKNNFVFIKIGKFVSI